MHIVTFHHGKGGYGHVYGISGIFTNKGEAMFHIQELNKQQKTKGSHPSDMATYRHYDIVEMKDNTTETILFTDHYPL